MCYDFIMQDIYQTFEFSKIQESIKEYSKTELGREYIDDLKMLSNLSEVKEKLADLNEMVSVVNRFGIMPLGFRWIGKSADFKRFCFFVQSISEKEFFGLWN